MVVRVGSLQERYCTRPLRETLIEWYGLPLVEWLEGPTRGEALLKEDLEGIAAKYRRKTRELKNRGPHELRSYLL